MGADPVCLLITGTEGTEPSMTIPLPRYLLGPYLYQYLAPSLGLSITRRRGAAVVRGGASDAAHGVLDDTRCTAVVAKLP